MARNRPSEISSAPLGALVERPSRHQYTKPKLVIYGSVREMTGGMNGTNPDPGQGMNTKLGGG